MDSGVPLASTAAPSEAASGFDMGAKRAIRGDCATTVVGGR